MATRAKTEGSLLLRKWLQAKNMSLAAFAAKSGIPRMNITRVVSGETWRRITVDFAVAVHKATGGRVPVEAWRSGTILRGES